MIIAAGDSFVYGSELADCTATKASDSSFTAILTKNAGIKNYYCTAAPGLGNDSISRSVITSCENIQQPKGVVVSWTFPGRYEFRFAYDTEQSTGNWYTITPWTIKTARSIKGEFHSDDSSILYDHVLTVNRAKRTGVLEFAETFYKHVGSTEYWEIYSSLKEIVYLQNYLKIKNIPYLFTCADNSLIYNYTVSQNDPSIMSLLNQIDLSNWFWFPESVNEWETKNPRGFYQWAVENKYLVGTTHPLEEAHQDAAQLIQEKFNAMVKRFVQ